VNSESPVDASIVPSVPTSAQPTIPADDGPDTLRVRIPALKARLDHDYLQLAKDIWTVNARGHYKDWGYESLADYVEDVGIPYDRATRLKRLWSKLILSVGLRPSQLNGIGYSNAQLLVPVIDKTSASDWIEKGRTLSYRDLRDEIEKSRPDPEPLPAPSGEPVSLPPTMPVRQTIKRSFYLTTEQQIALDEAITESTRISRSQSDAHNLYLICIKFLSDCMTQEQQPDARLTFFMRHLERLHGGRLLHVRTPEGYEVLKKAVEDNPSLFTRSDE